MSALPDHPLTTDASDLLRELLLLAPEANDAVLALCVERAFIEFCELSLAWRATLEPVEFDPESPLVDISLGAKFTGLGVVSVTRNGEPLGAVGSGNCHWWRQFSRDLLEVSAEPGDQIVITQAIKPQSYRGELSYSAQLLADYRDTVMSGAKAALFIMPRKEWSDPSLANYWRQVFMQQCHAAKTSTLNNYSRLGGIRADRQREYF